MHHLVHDDETGAGRLPVRPEGRGGILELSPKLVRFKPSLTPPLFDRTGGSLLNWLAMQTMFLSF